LATVTCKGFWGNHLISLHILAQKQYQKQVISTCWATFRKPYLNKLGKLNPESNYTEDDINLIFERTKLQNLFYLEKDIGEVS
jgi:hypothetical protein